MLGFCRDPLVRELHKLGYSLIPLPEARTSPGDCFARQGKELFRLGTLANLFAAGKNPEPEIARDIEAADLTITKSATLDSGLGLAMLTQWLGQARAEISGKLNKSAKFSFELRDVKKDAIDIQPLDEFLVSGSLNLEGPTVRQMLDGDDVYVTTSVLKARSLVVSTSKGTLVDGKVEMPEIAGLGASGDASLKITTEGDQGLVFEANKPLVFGFQAVQLCFQNGAYRSLRVERSKLQLMSGEGLSTSAAAAETGWLCDRIGSTFPRFAAAPQT
ncbi:hypothetical protein [Bradyrhizobium neotropicale]|nr:hypothetical protein [Bradyrhizobium neotropicale]